MIRKNLKCTLICTSVFAIIATGCQKGSQESSRKANNNNPEFLQITRENIHEFSNEELRQHEGFVFEPMETQKDIDTTKEIISDLTGIAPDSDSNSFIYVKKDNYGAKIVKIPTDTPIAQKENILSRIKRSTNEEKENSLNGSTVTVTLLKRNITCPMYMYSDYSDESEKKITVTTKHLWS